ncbi:MAG TPA: translocation/assembly module TamB domain-containing protein [Candidatus Rubrimentiphilum sp.]|nr:translocation/assembly module TamB domain-containing protein [Candidatus Rubrimentiphilum sp.]
MRKTLWTAIVVPVVAAIALIVMFHNAAARIGIAELSGIATGYNIDMRDLRFGHGHAALVDVHISRHGQPVLYAKRIDVDYSVRDLFPGSKHRFGLLAVAIDHPYIQLIHNANGTYNVALPPSAAAGPAHRPHPLAIPLDFTARIRDGQASLVDKYRYYKESRVQRVDRINGDIAINTVKVTHYVVTGVIEDAGPQPFRAVGTIDYVKGYALHRVRARKIRIATVGNYFIDSPAAHILGGLVHNMDVRMYAFDVKPNETTAYHIIGSGYMGEGSMDVRGLDSPILHLNGPISFFDGGFAAQRLSAIVGHIPIVIAGGIFDFRHPQFRLGFEGRGDLRYLKDIAHFARGLPMFGGVRIHALIEGNIENPLLWVGFDGARFNYQAVPIDNPRGMVALHGSNLVIMPFHGSYNGIQLHIQGTMVLRKQVASTLVLHAFGSSSLIPYIGALVAPQTINTEALLNGTDLKVRARGYLVSIAHPQNVNGFYDIDELGRAMFGPIGVRTPNGGTLVAGFDLDRPHGNSAFWASAQNVVMRQSQPITLPGVQIPQLPAIDAHIVQANIAGTGSASNAVIGGSMDMSPAVIAGVPFNDIHAQFAGPFANADISAIRADGPWGRFSGNGSFAPSAIVARGAFSGTLQGLRPFLGNFPAQGSVNGPMGIAIAQGRIYVQAQNAQLQNATIRGIPVVSITGTMEYDNNVLRVYSAQANAAGGSVVAAGSFATAPTNARTRMALATTQLDARTLNGFGVPISGGSLIAFGAIMPGTGIPGIDAGVVLTNGTAAGYGPFSASAEIGLANDSLDVRNGLAALGETFADVSGNIADLTSGVPRYGLYAQVPVGSISQVAQIAHLPTYRADGSFDANVAIGGAGPSPSVQGRVGVPVGEINGLGFSDVTAELSAQPGAIDIRNGFVQVVTTKAHFSAALAGGNTSFSLQSSRADLSDFNDYFDTGDTLAGHGSLALSFAQYRGGVYTSGNIDVRGLRYRRLPIGDTLANWTSLRNVLDGNVAVGGAHGELRASGTIGLVPEPTLREVIARSRYNVHGTLSGLDLGVWLPAFGYPEVPVTGRVNGTLAIVGAYPYLGISGNASIINGTLGPLPIERGQVAARAVGNRIDISSMVFSLPALDASGSGSFGFAPASPLNLTVRATTNDLPRLIATAAKKHLDVSGSLASTLRIGGTMHAPAISASVTGSKVNAYGISLPALAGELALRGRDVVIRSAKFTFTKGTATIAGSLPIELQPFAFGPPAAPIAMNFLASGVDLSAFSAFLGNGTKLGGALNGNIAISGSIANPRILGKLTVANGSYVSALETTPITQTVAQLTFLGTHATLEKIAARPGNGTLTGSGTLDFGGGLHGGPLGYSIAIAAKGAQLNMPQYGSGTIDANVRLQRLDGELAMLTGNTTITDAVVPFNAFLKFGGGSGNGGAGPPFNLGFNLGVTAGKNVRVRGGGAGIFGIDIPGQGHVQLAGTLLRPTLDGSFSSAGGTLTYIDHAFKVETGTVTFNPSNGVIPDIYAVGRTHVTNPDPNTQRNPTGAIDITVTINGPVTSPKIAFQSDPSGYNDQQLLALLLPFGDLAGPIQFTDTGVILPPGQLKGAPAVDYTGLLPPNIFVRRQNGEITIGQEAFNILNAQFISGGLLGPIENALGNTLGLSDVNVTLDYTGNFGVNFRRLLAKNFYALYGTTFGVPVRQTFGFVYQPNTFTSAQFTMFMQQGSLPLFQSAANTLQTNPRAATGQALYGTNGFTFLYQRLF